MEVERRLVSGGRPAYLLDGDNLRHGLNADLGFSAADRAENIRRVGEVARLFADAGVVSVVATISPYRADRDRIRSAHDHADLRFVEVFVDTPLEVCAARDPKGLYARARAGELSGLTGIDTPYEPPESPELVLQPADGDPAPWPTRSSTSWIPRKSWCNSRTRARCLDTPREPQNPATSLAQRARNGAED